MKDEVRAVLPSLHPSSFILHPCSHTREACARGTVQACALCRGLSLRPIFKNEEMVMVKHKKARPLVTLLLAAAFLSQPPASFSQTRTSSSRPPAPVPVRRADLRRQIKLISRSARGRVGAAV